MQVYTIRQYLSAGGQFDGTEPPGGWTDNDNGIAEYQEAASGGLFRFQAVAGLAFRPVAVYQVLIHLSAAVSWEIRVTRPEGDVVVSSGTGDTVYWNDASPILLAPDEDLKVVTGAGGPGYCFVYFTPADMGGY